jgi:hypothetical protein
MLAQWRDAPVALDSGSGALQPRYGAVRSVRFCLHVFGTDFRPNG